VAVNINRVIITGNLTRDPELRALPSGTSVCNLGVAVNTRRKGASGEWEDKPNFFYVTVFGAAGENAARFLAKGRPVAIDGRLEWRQWEQEGQKRQKVEIIADSVQFLGGRDDSAGGSPAQRGDITVDDGDFGPPPVTGGGADEDIPF
jgi:single-strand DNA-binding protein